MIYLSIPYAGHEYVSFRVSCAVAAKLVEAGNVVIAPIIHGHALSEHGHMLDHGRDFWLKHDLEILYHCNQVVVVKLKGWEESVGVQAEMAEARKLGIPILFVDPSWFVSPELMHIWANMDLDDDFNFAGPPPKEDETNESL